MKRVDPFTTSHELLLQVLTCSGLQMKKRKKSLLLLFLQDDLHSHRRTSAPASLAASRESLHGGGGSRSSTPSNDFINKRYSADLTPLEEWEIMHQGGSNPTQSTKPPGELLFKAKSWLISLDSFVILTLTLLSTFCYYHVWLCSRASVFHYYPPPMK